MRQHRSSGKKRFTKRTSIPNNRPLGRSHLRQLLVEPLENRCLLSGGTTLADLPAAAQNAISSAIGQDQSAYHAAPGAAGVNLANPANGFTAQVRAGALQVSAGADTWDMALVGLGYGAGVQPAGTAQTSANGNRVDLNYALIDEWYVNGPVGLEQGFTIAPPQSQTGRVPACGWLTLELALGGDLTGMVDADGDGLALSRPDGSAVLGYTGLTACDAAGKPLSASLEVQSDGGHQELLIHVDDAGAQGPITIDPYVQVAKLTASGTPNEMFGSSVSIDGGTLVVGTPGATVGGHSAQGAAFVFTGSGANWTQVAKLTASDGAANDKFGSSVSISGDTVVVGAPQAAVSGNSDQGATYVFTEPGAGWASMTQTAKLIASDGAARGYFGQSVSISGKTLVAGAWGANGEIGAAYVFSDVATGWAQAAELTASDGASGDELGNSVLISANTLVAGARYATVDGHSLQGAAYVFTEPGAAWANMTQTAKLTAADGAANDEFGNSVSISGNTLVVGAYGATVDGQSYQGAAYVFTEPGSAWASMTQTAKLTASDGAANDAFGNSVSISGNTVVAGANFAAVDGNSYQGAAYVFAEAGAAWANMTQTAKLTASDDSAGADFGASVSISGGTLVVGATGVTVGGNNAQGAAYVFAEPGAAGPT